MSHHYESPWLTDETRAFREVVRRFVETEFVPVQARWRAQGHADPEAWTKAGAAGLLLTGIPTEYGGGGRTFAHEVVILDELARAGVHFGLSVQNIVARYVLTYGSEEQKRAWLPRLARGA